MKKSIKKMTLVLQLVLVAFLLTSCATTSQKDDVETNEGVKTYISRLDREIKKNPNDIYLRFELANTYFKTKDYSKAERALKNILELKNAGWQDKSVVCVRLAKIAEIRQDKKKAMRWYEEGMEHEGVKGAYVVGNMGLFLENNKHYREAVALYYTVLERKNLSPAQRMEFEKRINALRILEQIKK